MIYKRHFQSAMAILSLMFAAWNVLWMISSSHLAHDFCNGEFALFHDQFRCRQPYIAMLLAGLSILSFCVFLVLALKNRQK